MMRPLRDAVESARRALAAYIDDMRAHLRECSTCAPDQYFFCSAALEIIKEIGLEKAFIDSSKEEFPS